MIFLTRRQFDRAKSHLPESSLISRMQVIVEPEKADLFDYSLDDHLSFELKDEVWTCVTEFRFID